MYANGGKSVKGRYKDFLSKSARVFFHERPEGLSLTNDMDYECFIVPHLLGGERGRTRFIVRQARELSARQGLGFLVMTENDFIKVTFGVARQDSE